MEFQDGKPIFRPAEEKILAALYELALAGVVPSFQGLFHFLRGEGMGLAYDGLWMCGGYPSMGRKRLGSLLSSLKKYHFVDGDVSSGTEYYYLSEDGTTAAKAYLGKNHKRSRSPRRGPEEFRRIER